MRIDPPPSFPCAAGTMPQATAAAFAARRSPWTVSEIPRVLRRTEQLRLRGRRNAELRCVRLAKDDEPAPTIARDELAIVIGHEGCEHAASERRPRAGEECTDVFQQERHAGEQTVRQAGGDGTPRVVVEPAHDGVDDGVAALDALDRGVEQLGRAHLPVAN